jgi:alkaline phosphatase D
MTTGISETFNKGADGWSLNGDVESSGWDSKGGDPGGYLSWVDAATGADSYYQAATKFLGNKLSFYGGTLSYDILDTGNGYTAYDVKIVGDGFTLEYTNPKDAGFPNPNVWSAASVKMVAADFVDTATGAAPSIAEMKHVMGDITQLDIRAEYVVGPESGGLDNVLLKPPSTAVAHALLGTHAHWGGIFS